MKKIQCVGAGFDPAYSSCSNLKPKTFEWSTEPQDIQVLIDDYILYANQVNKTEDQKRYGWVCESSSIVSSLVDLLYRFPDTIFNEGKYESIFTNDQNLLERDSRFVYSPTGSNLPWIPRESWGIADKLKLCSMVASAKIMCEGHKYRQNIACKFKDNIDLFGGACGSSRIGISNDLNKNWNDKRSAIIPYMFSIVMENQSAPNYYTEKLTDCFSTGTIPIYWGATNIGDFFDDRGIIRLTDDFTLDQLTPELYEEMLPYVGNNYAIVQSLEMADDELARKII